MTTRALVLIPAPLVCRKQSAYRRAIEAALAADGAAAVEWRWQDPSSGACAAASSTDGVAAAPSGPAVSTTSLHAQAQALLKADPDLDMVLVPGLESPYQAQYFTRLFRDGEGRESKTKRSAMFASSSSASSIIHMTTLRLAPTERAYQTAAAICRHFGWSHVALLSSDDNHMQAAQGLRQQLTGAGIHIRRHQIFSSATPLLGEEDPVAHDLDAIRSSGVRIVFLLSSCRATHQVLSAARRKGMLRDYAWLVLHPTSSCSLSKGLASSQDDLGLLETYQGVLGLAWDASAAMGSDAWAKAATNGTAVSRAAAVAGLGEFCSSSGSVDMPTPEEDEDDDALDLAPGFLYEALRHLSSSSSAAARSVASKGDSEEEGLVLHPDLGISVLSFSGARRPPGHNLTASTIEVIHQPIARVIGGMGKLELMTARPLRWPGDVRTLPRDLVEILGSGGEGEGSGYASRSPHGLAYAVGLGPLLFGVAALCIALTPLWNWLYKALLKPPDLQPPCLDGGCAPIPSLSEVKDAASQEEDKAFIEARMAELTEKQAELLRSVEVNMEDVVMKKNGGIGQGSFSVVYKGYYQNSHVAIKVLRRVDERNFRRFLEEILLHKDLRHPNVVMFRGASWKDGRLLMLVDYAGRGTLADVLRRSQNTLRWKPVKLNMALGIAKGMAFLHQTRYYDMWTSSYQRCIVHRDLKPQNILVTDSYHVLITDFGEARTVDHENTMTQVGTQLFVAPEVVRGERYTEKCDVYSFAVVLLAMLELRPDVLDVFAEALSEVEKSETGITQERLKEPQGVEVTDACKTCPLNKGFQPQPGQSLEVAQAMMSDPAKHACPMAQHKEFKGVVGHAVTRAVVYDDLRPPIKGCAYPSLKALIKKCWTPEMSERPSFAHIVDLLDSSVRKEVVEYTRTGTSGSSTFGSNDLLAFSRDGGHSRGGRMAVNGAGNNGGIRMRVPSSSSSSSSQQPPGNGGHNGNGKGH